MCATSVCRGLQARTPPPPPTHTTSSASCEQGGPTHPPSPVHTPPSPLQETTGIPCFCNEYVGELQRGVRQHFTRFIDALKDTELRQAQLGLAHSYSRAKVKFNVNKVDNMIIQVGGGDSSDWLGGWVLLVTGWLAGCHWSIAGVGPGSLCEAARPPSLTQHAHHQCHAGHCAA